MAQLMLIVYLTVFFYDSIYRFNPELALKKLRGKRLLFVGDSLQRGQWQSFVCLVEWIIPEDKKSMKLGRSHSIFKAKVNLTELLEPLSMHLIQEKSFLRKT